MFSRVLTKLIDEAIVPAVLLISAKVLGVVVASSYYNIPLGPGSNYFTLYFLSHSEFLMVNTFSIVFMLVIVFLGGVFFLIRSRALHDTHIKPSLSALLFSIGLGKIIRTSFDVYSEGTIWLSYSYLLTLVVGLELYFSMVYPWVFVFSVVLSVLLTLIFVSDVEKELGI